jgi:hypothetical protein
MATIAHIAGYYGLPIGVSESFIQGYLDGMQMRLDQKGQGVACGRGWIPRSKKCSRGKASQTSKEARAKTVEKAKERAKLKSEVKAAKGMKPYVKPKPEPTDPNNPSPEFAKKWGDASWSNTPKDVKAVIDSLPKPREILEEEARKTKSFEAGAFQMGGGAGFSGIYMGTHQPNGLGRDNAVYRHEYGHHVDHMLSIEHRKERTVIDQRLKEVSGQLVSLYQRAKANVDDLADKNPGASKEVQQIWAEYRKERKPIDDEYNELSKRSNELWNTTDYASSSVRSLETMRQDGDRLKKAKANAQKKMQNELKAILYDAYDSKTKTYDTLKLGPRQGFTSKERSAIEAFSSTGKGTAPSSIIRKVFDDKAIEELTRRRLNSELFFNDEEIDLASMPKALRGIGERMNENTPGGDMFKSDKLNLLMVARYGDPSSFLNMAEMATGHTGMVQDLSGSMTKNEIGRGHSDDYYSDETRQSVETFANVFNFLSSGDPLEVEISKYLAPGYTKYVKSLLDKQNRGR